MNYYKKSIVFAYLINQIIFTNSLSFASESDPYRKIPDAEYRETPYTGPLQSCHDQSILNQIKDEISHRESFFYKSTPDIVDFKYINEIAYRPNSQSYIPRRYCQVEGLFDDGITRQIYYNISSSLGFVSVGSGIQWCVKGLDKLHAYDPGCRGAGP